MCPSLTAPDTAAPSTHPGLTFYEVDEQDRVMALNEQWDSQAQGGDGGDRCSAAAILGRPLLDFVAGDATRMFMRAALAAVRLTQQPRVLPYRCDSPSERRRFEMVVRPLPQGRVRIEHRLVHREPRLPSLQRLARKGHMAGGWCCSQCLSVKLLGADDWLPPETLDTQLLAVDVCPACQARLEKPPVNAVPRDHT